MCNAVFEEDALQAIESDILLLASPLMCKSDLRGSGIDAQWKKLTLWETKLRIPRADEFRELNDGGVEWTTYANRVCPTGSFFFDEPIMPDYVYDEVLPNPDDYNPPHDISDTELRHFEDLAKQAYNETEYSICFGETLTDLQYLPGGFVSGLILMNQERELIKEFVNKSVDAALAQLVLLEQAVGKYVDILSIAHDFSDNRGVIFGEPLWREIYKPCYKRLFGQWGKLTNMKSNLHCCGSVYGVLDDLVDSGVDIINPVQISAKNMLPKKLKEEYGNKIIFWGGAYDARCNSPDDDYEIVYKRVSENIRVFGERGGYIMAGVHNLPPETPDVHLAAMLDAWRDNRYIYHDQ